MTRRLVFLAVFFLLLQPCGAEEPEDVYGRTPEKMQAYGKWDVKPHKHFFLTAPVYRGPGRDEPEPEGLKTVRFGLFTPVEGDSDDAEAGRNTRDGILLALEEANAQGGYRRLPFELMVKDDRFSWTGASTAMVELTYKDQVWALVGSIDSNSTHVIIRMALKSHLPIINVGANSPDLTETNVPWLMRCNPDDRQASYVLAKHIFEDKKLARAAVLRSADRFGRTGVMEFRDAAVRLSRPLSAEILFEPGTTDFSGQLERIEASGADALVIWAKARDAGQIVKQMRERGMKQAVFGTDRMVTQAFLDIAGPAAEGTTATYWMDLERQDPDWHKFRERFQARFKRAPEEFAAYAYDSMNLILDAVRRGGLNKVRIREELYAIRTYSGVSGTMVFDATANNVAKPFLTRVEGGRFVFH